MIKQISSIDLNFLLKELETLKDSRINKIYQPEKNTLIFSFYKTNMGKNILKINIGKFLYIDEEKENYETLGFGMFLRKHIDGHFLYEIESEFEADAFAAGICGVDAGIKALQRSMNLNQDSHAVDVEIVMRINALKNAKPLS